eukprot:363901-Chlamydomonas_euryale.AAC.19
MLPVMVAPWHYERLSAHRNAPASYGMRTTATGDARRHRRVPRAGESAHVHARARPRNPGGGVTALCRREV